MDDVEVVLNPNDPVLEAFVPILTLGLIDVDIGDDARIDQLQIRGSGLRITAWCRLTPALPFQVSTPNKRAFYTFDMGAMFSNLAGVSSDVDPTLI